MSTRDKHKYQNQYQSTLLAMYCRKRNKKGISACLKLGADPNIEDTCGLNCLDLLFIGKVEEEKVMKIMKKLVKGGAKYEMKKEVYQMYYKLYGFRILYEKEKEN